MSLNEKCKISIIPYLGHRYLTTQKNPLKVCPQLVVNVIACKKC